MLLVMGIHATEIRGVVVDPQGRPVPEARAFLDAWSTCCRTDLSGRFAFSANQTNVIFRKSGYRSALVLVQDAVEELRVVLQPEAPLPFCGPKARQTVGLNGWSSALRFRDRAGLKLSKQSADVDYGIRHYSHGSQFIRHGSGPMWSLGLPKLDPSMKNYEERSWSVDGIDVEARGESSDGKRSRFLGKFGETVEYRDVDSETAKIFDKFLDSVCVGGGQ